MANKSNGVRSGGYIAVNDRIGEEKMPVEGTEPPRSFAAGTGKRKYDKDDESVVEMRKRRAKTYANPLPGMPWGFTMNTRKAALPKKGQVPHKKKRVVKSHTNTPAIVMADSRVANKAVKSQAPAIDKMPKDISLKRLGRSKVTHYNGIFKDLIGRKFGG